MNREAEIRADMNAAEGAAQASAAAASTAVIQGNAPSALDELSRLDADVLILVDLVADASRRVELIERPALFAAFREKAAAAPIPKAHELLEDADRQMDSTYNRAPGTVSFVPPKTKNREANRLKVPTLRDQREAFTRRELLRGLLEGRLAETAEALERENASAEAAEAQEAPEPREITEAYFNQVVDTALARDCGVANLTSWDEKEYFHYRPLLSASYARILSAKNNPAEMICDLVREHSRIYPRPVTIGTFQEEPFNLKPEELQELMQSFPKDPKKSDIKFTTSSLGTVFLYSNKYLEDDYADFLAQYLDVDQVMSP
jgi:hypothetical protein